MASTPTVHEVSEPVPPTPALSSRMFAPREHVCSVADLSDDIFAELCTYLPPRDVVALSSTCRRFNLIGKDPVLWSELVKRDFRSPLRLRDPTIGRILTSLRTLSNKSPTLASPSRKNNAELASPGKSPGNAAAHSTGSVHWFSSRRLPPAGASVAAESASVAGTVSTSGGVGPSTALQKYAQRYKRHQAEYAADREGAEQTAEDLTLAQKRLRLRLFLDCCQFDIGLGCLPWLVTLWLVLLALRTGGAAPNLPWGAVWAPVIVAILLPAVMGCIALCTRAASSRRNSACWRQSDGERYNAPYYWKLVLEYEAPKVCCKPLRLFLVAAMWILLLLSPILIVLRLEGAITGSWGLVLLPLWVVFPCVPICGPLIGLFPTAEDSDERTKVCAFLGIAVSLVLPTIGMTAAVLNGATISMGFVLLPMFLGSATLASLAAFAFIDSCSNHGWENRRTFCCIGFAYLALAALSFAGLLAASILEGKQQYQAVARWLLIPCIVVAALASLVWCRLTLAFRRAAREHTFRALYTQRWWNVQRAVAANMPAGHGVAAAMRVVRNDLV